jgi:hypothetical protein
MKKSNLKKITLKKLLITLKKILINLRKISEIRMKPIAVTILFIFIALIFYVFPQGQAYCDNWLNVEVPEGSQVWIDTSHWEARQVLVNDGYYKEVLKRRWVDTSYKVQQGYWETSEYKVWVVSSRYEPFMAYRYVDTSHFELRSREVEVMQLVNFTLIEGTDSYGWSVYAFAAKAEGLKQITYNGEQYYAYKWVIDYRPYMGGRIYAVKWLFVIKSAKVTQYYYEWVNSGYWKAYTAYRLVDDSHWETRTGRHWVDSSYMVSQGYWEEYEDREWVDTSYYENTNVWISEGHYATPIHGEVTVEKDPKYVFTKWHKDDVGENCSMKLKVSWKLDNSKNIEGEEPKKIIKLKIYENVYRYKDKGINKIIISDDDISASEQGQIETITFFEYPGSEDSILHIYLYAQNGESAHIFFKNPINGYRSINIDSGGTDLNANSWLGGNNFGKVEF